MFDKSKKYAVKNRSASMVFYNLPEMNGLSRIFSAGETKEISGEELQALSYRDGGQSLLDNYLLITDEDAKAEVIRTEEPEYDLDEKGVYNLLKNGSDDQLTDCLNFAPDGVKDLVKTIAVEMPLRDLNKCEIIKEILGFDVVYVLQTNKEIAEEEGTVGVAKPKRRVSKSSTTASEDTAAAPKKRKRKVENPDYKTEE